MSTARRNNAAAVAADADRNNGCREFCINWFCMCLVKILILIIVLLFVSAIVCLMPDPPKTKLSPEMEKAGVGDLQHTVQALSAKTISHELAKAIHIRIGRHAPDTTSFSLGRDPKTGRFNNVIMDATSGELIIKTNEPNPIGLKSEYIELREHGTVMPNDENNSFQVSGMGEIVFKCPAGFSGHECHLTQFCNSVDDVGKFKPVTMQLFNMLNLNDNARNRHRMKQINNADNSDRLRLEQQLADNIIRRQDVTDAPLTAGENPADLIHPRIRMHCLTTNGGYILETCPSDKLLNEKLNCVPYDMCADRLAGSRHNRNLDPSKPLGDDEYYMCESNHSVRKRCEPGTIYDAQLGGCVSASRCYNKGTATFAIDNTRYLQCNHDNTGTTIDCAKTQSTVHYDENTRRHSCRTLGNQVGCVNRTFEREDDAGLKYVYGEQTCEPVEKLVLCDTTPQPERFVFKWAEQYMHVFETWPSQVMGKNGKCTDTPPLSIIHRPVPLRFTRAMHDEHPFDFQTMEYVCDPDVYRYRWDYIHNAFYDLRNPSSGPMNNTNGMLINTASPCQIDQQFSDMLPAHYDTSFLHPPVTQKPFIFISVPVYLPAPLQNALHSITGVPSNLDTFWPVHIPDLGYVSTSCTYINADAKNTTATTTTENPNPRPRPKTMVIRTECNTRIPPIGFGYKIDMTALVRRNATQLEIETAAAEAAARSTQPTQLNLYGYPDAVKNGRNHHYFIASGDLMNAQIAINNDYAMLSEISIPIERDVDVATMTESSTVEQPKYFTFNWMRVREDVDILPNLKLTSTHIVVDGVSHIRGFIVLTMYRQSGNRVALDVGGLGTITFDSNEYPALVF